MKKVKILEKNLDYETPRLRIFKYKTAYPNKKLKDYFVIDRYGDFSVVIPLFPDMKTVLVGQYRVPVEDYSWEYPMGSVRDKTPLQMAKQELKEETGFSAKKYTKLGVFNVAPGYSNQKMHVFVAEGLIEGEPSPEPFEYLDTKKIKLETVKSMVKDGTIIDSPTVLANFLLEQYLSKK